MIEPEVEARLLESLRSGKDATRKAALSELYELMSRPLFHLCLRVTGERADAEDALQETFVGVLRGASGFRGESRLATWTFRVAIHAATRVRSRRSRRTLESLPADGTESQSLAERGPGDDPETQAIEREDSRRVLEAIASLPAAQRAVLGLAAADGLDRAEIAAVLGIPVGTVDSRLFAARARLREELARRSEPGARQE